jgi:histidyl-tRNA synthetase
MANKLSTKPPSGMRDFLAGDVARRRFVVEKITAAYESFGFVPIETPTIENLSTLLGKYGEEGDQLLYRILHRRDALTRAVEGAASEGRPATALELSALGLRYDLTVPLARVVAQYGDLPKFFKRYQVQPVWRADRPGRGRFREFYQCDVDVTGTTSLVADAEVCGAVAAALDALGFDDYEIRLNHRGLLRAMVRAAGVIAEHETTALVAVDKLDKIGREGVTTELIARGISPESAEALLGLVISEGSSTNDERLDTLASAGLDDEGRAACETLRELLTMTTSTPAGARLRVSPELARGLSYYTGPIFEIAVSDLQGSLGGGGRYDGLVGMFGKRSVPAVGFSLGLERILVVMEERGMYPAISSGPEVMLCWFDVDSSDVLALASTLRSRGVRVEVYPESTKLKKQLAYAASDGVGAAFALILGPDELDAQQPTLRDLTTGAQRSAGVEELASLITQGGFSA